MMVEISVIKLHLTGEVSGMTTHLTIKSSKTWMPNQQSLSATIELINLQPNKFKR
jgi:hypothetical protein